MQSMRIICDAQLAACGRVAKLQRYIIPNYGFVDPRTGGPIGWHKDLAVGVTPVSQLTLYGQQITECLCSVELSWP